MLSGDRSMLVFLSGFLFAVSSILLVDRIRSVTEAPITPFEPGLLPDPASIEVVDESHVYAINSASIRSLQKSSTRSTATGNEAEALTSLAAAVQLNLKGNRDKARKLFIHALALCPKHPKILNHYGEFLESADGQILQADHLYVRAMAFADVGTDEHKRALQNRQRTQVMVEEIDLKILERIDEKKRTFQRVNEQSSSLRKAKKEAYFHHIYHTVGIEGNTMTLSQTRSILETKLAVGGKSIIEHNEVLGLDAALKYINQTLVDRPQGHIFLKDLLEIHKRVIGYVDPTEAGFFRETQVFVGDHIPPHPSHIDPLMQRFETWLNSEETLSLHPIRIAALAHYKLVYVHPFVDGNGRTSRLLMNLILMQRGFPPVIIRKQDRLLYYQHLVTANDGDIRPFIRFIAECAERTLDAYLWSTKENSLVPFTADESDTIISAQDHLDYHDKVVLGGTVGNITVEP